LVIDQVWFFPPIGKSGFIRASRISKLERGIWQQRYWEHQIRDECDFEKHVNYIHYNPVKHGYVKRPIDWHFSSHRYVQAGVLPEHWASELALEDVDCGER
jgi:putative transposase